MLSSGSRDQLCCPPTVLLWSWVFTVLVYWGLVSLPHPLSWVKVRDPSVDPLLSACCGGLLIVFQFSSVIWLWMLLTCSGDELCGTLPAPFQAVVYPQLAVSSSAFPAFIYWKFTWRSAPCSPTAPHLRWTYSTPPPPLCVSFQFIVYSSGFFLQGGGQSA
jgi:hypothetical protein